VRFVRRKVYVFAYPNLFAGKLCSDVQATDNITTSTVSPPGGRTTITDSENEVHNANGVAISSRFFVIMQNKVM